jgi:hypothetical protein
MVTMKREPYEPRPAEAAALRVAVSAALADARAAAVEADARFLAAAEDTRREPIPSRYDGAHLYVMRPSPRFREALRAEGALGINQNGRWRILCVDGVVTEQSVTADVVACEAAREVLSRRFPDESFHVSRRQR